jgi:LPS sulfotransferase NodH
MICATPRSGSTLLCEALRNTGLAGNPDEYFGPMHVKRWNEEWKTKSEIEYLEKVIEQGRGENGVWGMKVMRLYWQNLINDLQRAVSSTEMPDTELLNVCFPNLRYIWITRRDKVRQAISWLKFVQGSAWYWEDKKPQELEGLEFKPDIIRGFITQAAIHESAWQEFFRELDVQPYIVMYEDFVNTYEETAKDILKYLEIPYQENLKISQRRIKKQADALTDEWVQKYLAMYKETEKM